MNGIQNQLSFMGNFKRGSALDTGQGVSGGFRKGSALDSATRRSYLFNVPTQEPEQDIEEDKSSIQTEIHYIEPGRDYEP